MYRTSLTDIHRDTDRQRQRHREICRHTVGDLIKQRSDGVISTIQYEQHRSYVGLTEVKQSRLTSDHLLNTQTKHTASIIA